MQQHEIAQSIATKVRAARARAGFSRKRLGQLASVSERYLNDLEKGDANVSVGILGRIATALDVELPSILPGFGEQTSAIVKHKPLADIISRMTMAEQQAAVQLLCQIVGDRCHHQHGIALLGLRGAGKSTIGRLFAERHGLPFRSVTREVEARAGMSLADLFNLGGSEAYRALEMEVVNELAAAKDKMVIETAGGIAGNSGALDVVLGSFKTIWLKASPEEHLSRVARQGDTRPMRGNPKALDQLKLLLVQRESEYARAESALDTTGKTPEQCVSELERIAGAI
ncbi:MAG: helix-turn-helix domain-containing protein [Hyphomicrobiaceae bacterium]|nr:MAG: helix-turn-helix domain-containing protein [Hyphomicrobiaceae bacterium]